MGSGGREGYEAPLSNIVRRHLGPLVERRRVATNGALGAHRGLHGDRAVAHLARRDDGRRAASDLPVIAPPG